MHEMDVFSEAYHQSAELERAVSQFPDDFKVLKDYATSLYITIAMKDVMQSETILKISRVIATEAERFKISLGEAHSSAVRASAIEVMVKTFSYLSSEAPQRYRELAEEYLIPISELDTPTPYRAGSQASASARPSDVRSVS